MSSKLSSQLLSSLGLTGPILVVGAAWDCALKPGLWNKLVAKEHYADDVDLSCVAYGADHERLDTVWYAHLKGLDGAIRHTGDDTVGDDGGDDESLAIDFAQLDSQVQHLFVVLSCFGKDSFAKLQSCAVHLQDAATRQVLWALPVAVGGQNTASLVLHLQRTPNGQDWQINPLEVAAQGHNIQEIYMELRQQLQKA